MPDNYTNDEILDAIEADFDFHQHPTQFTLARLLEADQWLKEAALEVLAKGGFHPSGSDLTSNTDSQRDI